MEAAVHVLQDVHAVHARPDEGGVDEEEPNLAPGDLDGDRDRASDAAVPPMLTLPPEDLAHIFNMLDVLDVISVGLVRRDWLDIANRHVLLPRGHLAVAAPLGAHADTSRRHPTIHTLHFLQLDDLQTRDALSSLGNSIPLDDVDTVWLHGGPSPEARISEDRQRDLLDALFDACVNLSSINFWDVPQSASYTRLMVERGPKPRFGTRCVFTESSHCSRSALAAMDELGAFFQEAVVTTLKPTTCTTARYPHYWNPLAGADLDLDLPFHSKTRALSLHAAALDADAFKHIARMRNLCDLQIHDAEQLDDDALQAVVSGVASTGLRRLAVHDAPLVTSAGWAACLQSGALRDLEALHLSGCPQVDDASLAGRSHSPVLATRRFHLDLECCENFGEVGFQLLSTSFPRAEVLDVAVPFSTSAMEGLRVAAAQLPRLRRLAVRVQGAASTWSSHPHPHQAYAALAEAGTGADAREAIAGVERLKRDLRKTLSPLVQMDVTLTFVKLGMAASSPPDDELTD